MKRNRVFVTGLGVISSIGNSREELVESLRVLKHGFASYPVLQDDPLCDVTVAGRPKSFEVDSTDCEDWEFPDGLRIRREILRGLPPHGPYAYFAMKQAIEDAGLSDEEVSNPETGIYTASGGSQRLAYKNFVRMAQVGPMRCPPTGIVSSIAGTLSFNLVAAFKIHGNSCGFSSACASSGHAIGYAFDDLTMGRQKRMFIAAGEDVNFESIVPFSGMRALSLEDDPDRASCPFDKKRTGFVCTGGGATLVLETEEEMNRRGAKPYAELLGWGQSSDGYNVAISHPEGHGLTRAMRKALEACEIDAGDVDYINAHATSTLIGDASEGKAIREVFEKSGHFPKISSTKAITGHGLSLASALEAAIVSASMKEGITPGSAHIEEMDPQFEGLNIIQETESQAPGLVLSNSSGFGGANVTLVLRKV